MVQFPLKGRKKFVILATTFLTDLFFFQIQVAALTSEKHKVQEHLRTSSEQHQRTLNAYQQKIATLREECRAAQVF